MFFPKILVFIFCTGLFFSLPSCTKKTSCPAYKNESYLVKNTKRFKKKRKNTGLFETRVAAAYGLHRYESHTSDRKAKRLLKKELEKKEGE